MTENKSDEDSAWGKIVKGIINSDKRISDIAASHRENRPDETRKFREKALKDPKITDTLSIFAQDIEPETKLDVNTFHETGEEKYCVYIHMPIEEYGKYYSRDEKGDRMSKWDDFSEKLTEYFEKFDIPEKRRKAYVHLKRGKP